MLRFPATITFGCLILVTTFVLLGCNEQSAPEETPVEGIGATNEVPTPAGADKPWVSIPVTISKETTYITSPLRKDGYVDYLAALRRQYSKGVTADTNGAVLICRAIGPAEFQDSVREVFFEQLGVPVPPAEGKYFIDLHDFAEEHGIDIYADENIDLVSTTLDRPWTPKTSKVAADWLDANDVPLRRVTEASRCDHIYFPLVPKDDDGTLDEVILPLNQLRSLARALRNRAMLRLGEGRVEDAEADLLTIHRLGALTRRVPRTIPKLIGISLHGIAIEGDVFLVQSGNLTNEQATRFRKDREKFLPTDNLSTLVNFEMRFKDLDRACRIFRRGPKDSSADLRFLGIKTSDIQFAQNQQQADDELRVVNEIYDLFLVALQESTFSQRQTALEKLSERGEGGLIEQAIRKHFKELFETLDDFEGEVPEKTSKKKPPSLAEEWLGMMATTVKGIHNAEARGQSRLRMVAILFALASYHDQHAEYPEKISALVPQHIDRLPVDGFDGHPFVYLREKAGFKLYTVGENGKDEGGNDVAFSDDWMIRIPVDPSEK